MQILVTGGTGFLGQHLVRALLAKGHSMHVLGRNFTSAGAQQLVAGGAIPITADLRDRVAVEAACTGIEVICHAGALSAPWGRRVDFYDINVGGTANVLAGCLARGGRRLVYISSPGVVFDARDQQLVSANPPSPPHFTPAHSVTQNLAHTPLH